MRVEIHPLFERLLATTGEGPAPGGAAADAPEAVLGFSLATPPKLGEFLAELDPEMSLDWSNRAFRGLPSLRRRVLERAGLAAVREPDDVLITAGTAEANFLAFTQLVAPGDEVVLEAPGWPQAQVLAEAIGARVRWWRRREEHGWALDPAELEELVGPDTRLIFLCNPNNPTGALLGEAELRRVVAAAERVGAFLLCDEVYAGLEWRGERAPAAAGLSERAISTGSVSKALGLQGLRIGWLVCGDPRVVFDAMVLRENTSEIMNVMGEAIAELALGEARYARALARARLEGAANLARLERFLAERPELSWQPPAAGLIGLARLHLEIDGDELARRLLAPPYRTFLVPGSAYGCPQHLRLGVGGGPEAGLELGLERLAQLLDEVAA